MLLEIEVAVSRFDFLNMLKAGKSVIKGWK